MSNLLTDNIYFDCQTYNNTSSNIQCKSDDILSFDILSRTSDFNICITKAQIPLDSIPLTNSNIPLKTYQITISKDGLTESSYVRQYNSTNDNYLYTATESPSLTTYKYTSTTATSQGSISLSSVVSTIFNIALDDYLNYYVIGNNDGSSSPSSLYVLSSDLNVLAQISLNFISGFHMDRGQNIYLADNTETGSIVHIYSNLNGVNSVELTEIATLSTDFAGNLLQNVNFVIGESQYLIVGHDGNIFTFYNPDNFQPIVDKTETITGKIRSANILEDSGTFLVADDVAIDDKLFGNNGGILFEITNNNEQLSNTTLSTLSKIPLLKSGDYLFGSDGGNTMALSYPPNPPPQSFVNANTSTVIKTIANDGNVLYGLNNATQELYTWNQGGQSANNKWYETSNTFQNGVNPIIDFDFNESTHKIYAVDSTNNLYKSTNPVRPAELYNVDSNYNFSRLGYESKDNTPSYTIVQLHNISNCTEIVKVGVYYYVIVGEYGSQQIQRLNISDFSVDTTYPCAEMSGTISNLNVKNYIVASNGKFLYCYDTSDGHLIGQYMTTTYDIVDVALTYNGDYCIIADNYTLYVLKLSAITVSYIMMYSIPSLFTTTIMSLCLNYNDVVNSTDALFIGGDENGESVVYKITFNTNYASVDNYNLLYNGGGQMIVKRIRCNSNYGQLLFKEENTTTASEQMKMVFQSLNYTNTPFIYPNISGFWTMPQELSNSIFFESVNTGGFLLQSIAVSRSNPQTLYALGSVDSLLYSGTCINNTCTFTRLTEYTETYTRISTALNDTVIGDTTLRLYSLNNQTQTQTVNITGNLIKSIARNDTTLEYLIPLSENSQVKSYNPESLALNYTLSVPNCKYLYAKGGDDISAGPFNIYYMSILINAINSAFQRVYDKLAARGATTGTAPHLSLDYNTQLLTLTYDPNLAKLPDFIEFNQALLTICNFQNVNGQLVLSATGTTTQGQKSIFRFNKLTGGKIKFSSSTLFVNGNFYGKVVPQQQNDNTRSNHVITDLDIPTDTFIDNVGQILYYQPNGTLRPYTMYSNLPLRRINLDVNYEYRDLQTEYSLFLLPDQNFTVKLNFIKKY